MVEKNSAHKDYAQAVQGAKQILSRTNPELLEELLGIGHDVERRVCIMTAAVNEGLKDLGLQLESLDERLSKLETCIF